MTGLIIPGQNLTLRATAEAMGTSPMPVRDAVRRLEIEHALVARSNRTLSVPEMTYASLMELREVRMVLEGLAAEKAAMLITAEELAEVESCYREMAAAARPEIRAPICAPTGRSIRRSIAPAVRSCWCR